MPFSCCIPPPHPPPRESPCAEAVCQRRIACVFRTVARALRLSTFADCRGYRSRKSSQSHRKGATRRDLTSLDSRRANVYATRGSDSTRGFSFLQKNPRFHRSSSARGISPSPLFRVSPDARSRRAAREENDVVLVVVRRTVRSDSKLWNIHTHAQVHLRCALICASERVRASSRLLFTFAQTFVRKRRSRSRTIGR